MQNIIAKYPVLALHGNGKFRRDVGTSESAEEQETPRTTDGPTSYLC